MKHFLLIIAVLLLASKGFAQTETTVWNGKTYYVYPHQLVLQNNMYIFMQYAEFKEVLKRDDNNQKVIRTEVKKIEEEEKLNLGYGMTRKMTKEQKQQEKLIRELLEKKPDLFYQYGSNLSQDVTPSLTAIPDGEYIQYYRDLPYLDQNILRFKNDVVAGVFTVKNNQLEGTGTWYTVNGMVIKSGDFTQGSRQGSWFFNSYTPKRFQSELELKPEKAMEYLLNNGMKYDTTMERYDYHLGLRNGSYIQKYNDFTLATGSYKDDTESGTWDFFDFTYVIEADGSYRITDTLVNTKHLTYSDKKTRGKGPILRDEVVAQEFMYADYNYYGDEEEEESDIDTSLVLYNTHSSNGYFESFSSFYNILEQKDANEEGLELPEEGINSYEGEEYEGMPYPGYDNYYPEYGYGDNYPVEGSYDYNQEGSEYINNKFYTRNQLIDSVGYQFFYDGLYEEHYGNGQLKFRFEIKDGNLVSEDTVFWENGQAANTIAFDETSRQYTQHFFDYKGKLYKTVLFDEKGEEIRDAESEDDGAIMIDGLPYYNEDEYQSVAYYSARELIQDTLLTERTLIQAGRWLRDSTLCMTGYLDPETRVLDFTEYNVMGMPYVTQKVTFGEEYDNVNALTNTTVGKLRLETLTSGSLYDFSDYPFMYNPKGDSVLPQANALYWQGNYETTSDELLYINDQPFSGAFSIQTEASKYSLSVSEKAISLKIPETAKMQKKMRKALKKFYKKGKRSEILELYNSDVQYGGTDGAFYALFPSMSYVFSLTNNPYGEYSYSEGMYYDGYGYEDNKKNLIEYPFDKTLNGNYLNGKPEGEWIVKDQFGNITARINYSKGEREGESVFYATEFPMSATQRNYEQEYLAEYHTYIFETLPEKKTQYLSRREFYHNGLLDGPVVSFNWKGDTVSYDLYRDGLQNGPSYQRNKIFFAEASYEDGMIDGISRTYLTLPERDSILIFDLNFQNGSLQGESKSYHTNGNLAKRGFFLTGQPIDDYEAFDTLGFKYQYVKFQYNQPIEEKIWEENQLSVRYLFDWKDSIPFEISDIAGSTSFERLASDLGLIQNPYSEPYYGRPSLVDKTGINYNITKYYPNDTIARYGNIAKGKKVGEWKHFSYEGKALYEANYFDTILQINDSIRFKSKGILTYLDEKGKPSSKSYIIEKVEKYDCSHADHNEERMLYTFWEADSSQHRINGYVKNYYDNGAIQNEGNVVNGLPTGVWKMYDSDGQLNQVGSYDLGKRNGRWLSGDLSNMKNMSEICLNPNLENLEEIMSYQEKLLDVSVIYYGMGKILKREYYGINLNSEEAPEDYYREGDYYRE
ncbi:MAG: hypothetical protein V4604_10010 [Bacteroidota bacterium]